MKVLQKFLKYVLVCGRDTGFIIQILVCCRSVTEFLIKDVNIICKVFYKFATLQLRNIWNKSTLQILRTSPKNQIKSFLYLSAFCFGTVHYMDCPCLQLDYALHNVFSNARNNHSGFSNDRQ